MYSIEDYAYALPEELIAQTPLSARDRSRLMVLDRNQKTIGHHQFTDIVDFLLPDDVLIINDTRVVRARLQGRKETGGKIEVFLLDYPGASARQSSSLKNGALVCDCITRSSKPPRPGSRIAFTRELGATVLSGGEGVYRLKFHFSGNFAHILERTGEVPLPPYIKRTASQSSRVKDREAYQTVYARKDGAVAAPTAGLHFSDGLIASVRRKGVRIVPITLHVGYGTFLPVRVADIREHKMHGEWYHISERSAATVNDAKAQGRRVVAVGTTSVRSLEFAGDETGRLRPGEGRCDLYIYPGYRFHVVDALITNFHLPKSTLLMLVSAFAGREFILRAYQEAIRQRYRFYSYGDSMLIH
jgi:S-adenosylmethionine:tRNA ribosyltransferase-isomerase